MDMKFISRMLAQCLLLCAALVGFVKPAHAADTLVSGGVLTAGNSLQSSNLGYRLLLQLDGNLVLSQQPYGLLYWTSGTNGRGAQRLTLQSDGNLVLYTSAGQAVWASNTVGSGATRLVVQNDGNMVLYAGTGAAVWATDTRAPPPPTNGIVDATSLNRKVMAGYQGWFTTSNDGSGRGWQHWSSPSDIPNTTNLNVDMWPDQREYGAGELTPTTFRYANGTNAGLYSAYNPVTVDRHVRWMRDYGIDGVFVQRFISEAVAIRGVRDRVLGNVRVGAERYGRVFVNMYDITGGNGATLVSDIQTDWMHLVDNQRITESGRYLRHNGRPVLAIWGFGLNGNPGSASQLKTLLKWLNTDAPERYRATVMLGVQWDWRMHSSAWRDAYDDAAVISPWAVGGYINDAGADSWRDNIIAPDLEALRGTGVAYMPVIWPGFSWHNHKNGTTPLNQIPRRGGRHFWRQAYNAATIGASMIYVAMYDEVDEGTAIFKIAENASQAPSTGRFVNLDADGEAVPSDHYLRLMGEVSRMLRGERPLSATLP